MICLVSWELFVFAPNFDITQQKINLEKCRILSTPWLRMFNLSKQIKNASTF